MTIEQYINGMRDAGIDRGALERDMPASEPKTIGSAEERRQGYRTDSRTTDRGGGKWRPELEDLSSLNPDGWQGHQHKVKRPGSGRGTTRPIAGPGRAIWRVLKQKGGKPPSRQSKA